jgi:NTE family protein
MRLISGCKELAAEKGTRCVIDIPTPHQVEFFPIEVAFEYIQSDQDRNWFKNLPSSFELPRVTVDRSCAVGRQILGEDPQFRKLMEGLK